MRIALFHNLGAGGAKRHLYEQAHALHARGHRLDLFIPAEADEIFLPLTDFCEAVRVFGTPSPSPSLERGGKQGGQTSEARQGERGLQSSRGLGVRHHPFLQPLAETLWTLRQRRRVAALVRTHAEIAGAIDAGGYDAAYVHHDRQLMAPEILRLVRATPTVFCCHDTPRPLVEWPAKPEPGYDEATSTLLRRKRLGRFLVPAPLRFIDREVGRFEANTRAAGRVLANSFYSRECLARLTGINARVCYPGVDANYFTPAPVATPRHHRVLSVGAMLPNKQHEFILRAVAAIPASRRPRLTILGYESPALGSAPTGLGPEGAWLLALAAERGVSLDLDRDVSDETLRAAYRTAGVVAFAPYLEPFGLVALEAAACGTPVVGVREGGVRETVADGETGYLTDRDPVVFATALALVLDNPDLALRLGEQARARVLADWTWERSADALESHLAGTIAAYRESR